MAALMLLFLAAVAPSSARAATAQEFVFSDGTRLFRFQPDTQQPPEPFATGFHAVWSPSGDRLAILDKHDSTTTLRLHPVDGGADSSVAEGTNIAVVGWSPDGQKIAWSDGSGPANRLLVKAIGSTGVPVTVADDASYALESPGWSPDGRWLAWFGGQRPSTKLFVARPDGTTRHQLGPDGVTSAAWSPDSSRLLFGTPLAVEVVNVDSGRVRQLASESDVNRVDWSPDGRFIGWEAGSGPQPGQYPPYPAPSHQLFTALADGSRVTTLGPDSYGFTIPWSWSPDSSLVAYLAPRLTVVRPDGTGRRLLPPVSTQCGQAEWSPDSRRLVTFCWDESARPAAQQLFLIDVPTARSRLVSSLSGPTEPADNPGWRPGAAPSPATTTSPPTTTTTLVTSTSTTASTTTSPTSLAPSTTAPAPRRHGASGVTVVAIAAGVALTGGASAAAAVLIRRRRPGRR